MSTVGGLSSQVLFALVVSAWTLILASVVLMFIRSLSRALLGLFFFDPDVQADQAAARDAMVSGLDLLGEWCAGGLRIFTQGVLVAFTVFWSLFALLLLSTVLHILYRYFPATLGEATGAWNEHVGYFWSTHVVNALDAASNVFREAVGVYNVGVFAAIRLPAQAGFHMLANGFNDVTAFGREVGQGAASLAREGSRWGRALQADCASTPFLSSGGTVDVSCFDPDLVLYDFFKPMQHVHRAFLHLMDFFPRTCSVAAFPTALVVYPFTDAELGRAVHYGLNSVLNAVAVAPALAVQRFELTGRISLGVPDWGPAFDYAAEAARHLGRAFDNWLDVLLYMAVTAADPDRIVSCDTRTGSWDFASDAALLRSFGPNKTIITSLTPTVFAITDGHSIEYHHHGRRGGIRTRVAAWPLPINVSHGVAAVSYARDVSRDDAATSAHPTTALFGCMCTDDVALGMRLTCAVVPYEATEGLAAGAFVTEVAWEVRNTPRRMQCRDAKISVQSIRYQSQRVTQANEFRSMPTMEQPTSCASRSSCTRVDAALWVMPVCPTQRPAPYVGDAVPPGSDGACLQGFRDFSCFPFCLGVRRSFSANERIVIRSAGAWERSMLLTSRDCVFEEAANFDRRTSQDALEDDEDAGGAWAPNSVLGKRGSNDAVASAKIKGATASQRRCRPNADVISSVPKALAEMQTAADFFVRQYAFDKNRQYATDYAGDLYRFNPTDAMLLERQPFVFAGDFALATATYCAGEGQAWDATPQSDAHCTTVVDAMRISGSEFNEFSLRHVAPHGIPATRRPVVGARTQAAMREGRVTLPPTIVRSVRLHNPATSTRDAVWYAVNPDYEMLHCVLRYCRDFTELVNCLQISVLSNYDALRIWKLVPQSGCERDEHGIACPAHTARSVPIEDEHSMTLDTATFDYGEFCDARADRNLYVEHMDAFDPLNVVVAVRRGNVQALYDELWGGGGPANTEPRARSVFYFVNTQTLEVRENKPWTETPAIAGQTGFLCKEMRVMPSVGSAVAEAAAAGLMLFKTMLVAVSNLPGLVELFRAGDRRCEVADSALRHSFFEDCGSSALDLSDMFSALNRANIHAWSVLDFAGTALGLVSDNEAVQVVQTYLTGAQVYSENQRVLAYSSVTGPVGALLQDADSAGGGGTGGLSTLYFYSITTVGTPAFMAGMNIGASPLGVAEYFYRVLSRAMLALVSADFGVEFTPDMSRAERQGFAAAMGFRTSYLTLVNLFYESIRTDWHELVSMRARRACAGVSLMAGYTTPWGRFLRHWCLAGVELTDGSMRAAGSMLAELPVVECVCIRANDHDYSSFLRDTCAGEAPVSLRPLIIAMVAYADDVYADRDLSRQQLMRQTCEEFIDQFSDSLYDAFAPWAVAHTAAAEATIELFDWFGVLLGGQSAECADAEKNPFVSVMLPSPIDYFRVCGGTSACRSKCKPFADALQLEIELRRFQHRQKPMVFTTQIESSMFARMRFTGSEEVPLTLVAIAELPPDHDMCSRCPPSEHADCVGVVGMHHAQSPRAGELAVRAYCVPLDFKRHVFLAFEWQVADAPGVPVASFFDPVSSNRAVRADFSVPYGDHVLLLSEMVGQDAAAGVVYTQRFQRISAWRRSTVLRVQHVASSATLQEQCRDVVLGSLPPDEAPAFVDDATGARTPFEPIITHVEILDYFNFVSSAFSVDLVLSLHVHLLRTAAGSSTVQRTSKTVFLRLGWCEAFPATFAGMRRAPPPSECGEEAAAASRAVCLPLDQAHAADLMQKTLREGVLMYHPPRAPADARAGGAYSYLQTAAVAQRDGRAYLYPATAHLGAGANHSGVGGPLVQVWASHGSRFKLSTGLGDVLPGRAHRADVGGRKMLPQASRAIGVSLVTHRGAPRVPVEDASARRLPLWYAAAGSEVARAWLLDVRYTPPGLLAAKGAHPDEGVLEGLPSRLRDVTVSVERYCNGHVCSGCSTKRLQQICLSMQACIVRNCAGSLVNNDDLLCNFGLLMEAMYAQVTSMYIAAWHALVSIFLAIFETQTHAATPNHVRIEWVSDVFYTLVCESKDVIAALTGVVATIVHKGPDVFTDLADRVVAFANYDVRGAKEVNAEAYQQKPLQVAAIHQFLFQLALAPLYELFAVHRWLVCTSDDIVHFVSEGSFTLSLGELGDLPPGDERIGGKWKSCSNAAVIEEIVSATPSMRKQGNLQAVLEGLANDQDSVETLEAGIGGLATELPTHLALQMIDATAAYLMGVVTGIQDILYNVDDPQCQVSDVGIADAVQCACGDAPADIVPARRWEAFDEGAFWCSGVLYVAKDDGSFAYVYNPYSLDELGTMLEGMDAYLECSSSSERPRCERPGVATFDAAGVSPMTVLTRCRSNYLQRQWDVGAGQLFSEDFRPAVDYPALPLASARRIAYKWAKAVGQELHTCVTAHAGSSQLAGVCLDVFLRLAPGAVPSSETFTATGQRAESFFAYTRAPDRVAARARPTRNPDACLLFTGPAAKAGSEATRARFRTCLGTDADQTLDCELPALAWAGRMHSRVPVAVVHREAVSDAARRQAMADAMYQKTAADLARAFDAFGGVSAADLDVMFFSAEGDALHQMLDCMFLGPYARVDYVTTDANGAFEPLRWSRDPGDLGHSRDFELPCSGDALHNDTRGTPFTCGSPARRAIIKKYVREYMLNGTHINDVTAKLVVERVAALRTAYLDPANYGCAPPRDLPGAAPSADYCGDVLQGGRGFAPALPDFSTVNSSAVAGALFAQLDTFYRDAITDPATWETHYRDSKHTALWGHWAASRDTQPLATDHVFRPHAPVVSYNESETFRMPAPGANASHRLKHSVWGVCTALLGQPMLTIPLTRTSDSAPPHWKPPPVADGTLPPFSAFPDAGDAGTASVDEWMRTLMHSAWVQSPMYMHYVMRYVPSLSLSCVDAQSSDLNDVADTGEAAARASITINQAKLTAPGGEGRPIGTPTYDDTPTVPFRGFDTRGIGSARRACPCGGRAYADAEQLVLSPDTCWLSEKLCAFVRAEAAAEAERAAVAQDEPPPADGSAPKAPVMGSETFAICTADEAAPRQYNMERIPAVLHELHSVLPGYLEDACPEFTLSDQWGVYDSPDGGHELGWHASADALRKGVDAFVDGTHLWAHRPAGITPTNWEHVARETREGRGWSHATRHKPLADPVSGRSVGQLHCLRGSNPQDRDFPDSLLDDFFDFLFPVAQLVTEPWGLSVCTRYVLEHYKYFFLVEVVKAANSQAQKESAARWRDRCVVKARQSTICNALDIYSVVPARSAWDAARASTCRYELDWAALEDAFGTEFYVTPSCVLYVQGDFYDLHKCAAAAGEGALRPADVSDRCKFRSPDGGNDEHSLYAENPVWLTATSDHQVLHWGSGAQFAGAPAARALYEHIASGPGAGAADEVAPTRLGAAISRAFVHGLFNNILEGGSDVGTDDYEVPPAAFGNVPPGTCTAGILQCTAARFCDLVFDWWPESWQEPVGYHPTATCRASDNAFRTFDSYIAVERDPDSSSSGAAARLAYHHTALRSAALHYQWAGAAGLCRLHSVHQPMLETNSHRACTRAPRVVPNPAIPRRAAPLPPNTGADDARLYGEACGEHAHDVPWETDASREPLLAAHHPQTRTLGGLFDVFRVTKPDAAGGRSVTSKDRFPARTSMLDRGTHLRLPDDAPLLAAAARLRDKFGDPVTVTAPGPGATFVQGPGMPRAGVRVDGAAAEPWGSCVPPLEVVTCDVGVVTACPVHEDDGPRMRCVQVPGWAAGKGMCLSAHRVAEPRAAPCFRSDMCEDETAHCLAEGVCGHVSQHLWNTGQDDVEFTTLVEGTCGTNAVEQDFAGASPWETVPDLLAAHGMCAQRHRYSYMYAMQHRVRRDDSQGAPRAYVPLSLAGQTPRVEWPWLVQLPSGSALPSDDDERGSGAAQLSDRDRRTLHVFPHPCDQTAMHMPGFKVCSGIGGLAGAALIPYVITHNISYDAVQYAVEAWAPTSYDNIPLPAAHWLRTADPNNLTRVHVNPAFHDPEFRRRGLFSFLGGDKRAPTGSYAGVVGRSQASFLRCSSIELCGPPEYTFAGRTVERSRFRGDRRRRDGGVVRPLGTADFVLCGSIGFRRLETPVNRECLFDIDLFPHIRLLVSASGETSVPYCNELFGDPVGSSSRADDVSGIQLVADLNLPCDTGVLCCQGDSEATVACKYVGIGTQQGGYTPVAVFEALLEKINNIHRLLTVPPDMFAQRATMRGLAVLVECVNEISRVNAEYQAPLRSAYGTDTEAGLYHALTYHLFEFPVLWYYKWVYSTLIWPQETSPLRIALKAKDWLGVIDAGEAWHSRASTRQGTPRRCNGPSCVCQPSAGARRTGAMRDSLLCFNGGARLRLEPALAGAAASADGAGRRAGEAVLAEDTVDQYSATLKQGVMAEALEFVWQEYGIDPAKPETFLGGCHTTVRWREEVCLKDPDCKAHLFKLARGDAVDPAAFNPLDPAFEDYFVFEGFQLSDTTPNLLGVVSDIVDSYDFADDAFDGLLDGVLLRNNATTNDGETKWFYPLFRLSSDAGLTTEHDDISDDDPDRIFLVPPDPGLLETSATSKCIVENADVEDVRKQAAEAEKGLQGPYAYFSTSANGKALAVDVCADERAEPNAYSTVHNVMSCSFHGSSRKHGLDVCDYWGDTACDLQDVTVRDVWGSGAWMRLRANFRCTEANMRERPAQHAPAMHCRLAPNHNAQCQNFRSGATYPGYWARFARGVPQTYHLEFDMTKLQYQRFSRLTDGFTNAELEFLGTHDERTWMYQFGVRGKVIKAFRLSTYRRYSQNDDWWAHPILSDQCPLREADAPKYWGWKVVGQVRVNGFFPRPDSHYQPADTCSSQQPLHSMCHRVTSACFEPGAGDSPNPLFTPGAAQKCNLRYARLPPGVAARFFGQRREVDPGASKPRDGFPAWAWCPNDPAPDPNASPGHVGYSGLEIPVPKKAGRRFYPTTQAPVSCTAQDGEAADTCTNGNAEEEGCYVVDPYRDTEWHHARTRCSGDNTLHGGACSFSLTLAKNYFCGAGSGNVSDSSSYRAPDHTCPGGTSKVLVRGTASGARSLWKCAPCSKFQPIAATGLAKCGFQSTNETAAAGARRSGRRSASGALVSASGMLFSRDVVAALKEFIATKVHSVDHLADLHARLDAPFRAGAGDVRFDRASGTAYTSLHDLQAARDYEKWEGYREGGCSSAVNDADPSENTCMWPGRYDITHMLEKDEFYRSRPSNLQCASKTPRAAEYKRCSPESDVQRAQLRDWVDDTYRRALGAWVPVLPPARGVSWRLDRTATSNPFTLLFAAHHRPESQVHAQNVLGEAICRRGSRLHSICASLTRSGNTEYYLANPWPAGEFNVFMPDDPRDTLDAMGLDQCRQPGGRWEMCCTCSPPELCCLPDKLCEAGAEPPEYNASGSDNHFTRPGHAAACQPNAGRYERGQPIATDHPTNICQRDPIQHHPPLCRHHQGIVGAASGAPVQTLAALYHEAPPPVAQNAPRVEDFLVDRHPALWAGMTAAEAGDHSATRHRLLRMPASLLYPAHMVASAARAGTSLRMHAVQMQRNNLDGTSALFWGERLIGLREWVPLLQSEMARDAELVRRLYPDLVRPHGPGAEDGAAPTPAWHCPLRVVAFWGRDIPGFNPVVPDPTRADAMFHGNYYCRPGEAAECRTRGVHPYVESREYRETRDYFTPDGRCYFDIDNGDRHSSSAGEGEGEDADAGSSGSSTFGASGACGFLSHAAFVSGGHWASTHVAPSTRAECTDILDWPQQRLRYRNGERDVRGDADEQPAQQHNRTQACALLPRLAPFRIRIMSDAPLFCNASASTSDEGGDCHMGRATRISAADRQQLRQYEHCITVGRTATQAHIRCTGRRVPADAGLGREGEPDRLFAFTREIRLHPEHDILHAPTTKSRAACGQCDAADAPFTTSKGTERLEAETSTGIPTRFAGLRLLVRELATMCERDENCRLDEAEWDRHGNDTDAFLRTLLSNPSVLLEHATPSAAGAGEGAGDRGEGGDAEQSPSWKDVINGMPEAVEDEPLWAVPWLLHNNGDTVPRGVVDKRRWRTDRRAACWANLSTELARDEQETSTFVRPISICDLTADLQQLCAQLANARSDIAAANCLAKGDSCEVLSTFYTPAQWFVTNKAFARETVRDFYRYEAPDSCAGESDRVLAAQEENELVKRDCSATLLEFSKDALQYLRLVARMVVAFFNSVASIIVDLFLLIIYRATQQNISPLVADIAEHLQLLLHLTLEAVQQLVNLIITFFATIGGMAKWMAHIAYWLCVIVTWVVEIIIRVFVCILVRLFVEGAFIIIDFIFILLRLTTTFFTIGSFFLDLTFWEDTKNSVADFFDSSVCETSILGGCAYPYGWEDEDSYGRAFLATRCWTNPSPGDLLGDSNALGCSVSDTCLQETFTFEREGGELSVCEACPPVDPSAFARVGCDPLLKRCKCGVPLSARTGCVRNSDCDGNVPCRLMATANGPSYGTADCRDACRSQAVCFVEETATNGIPPVGQCVCMLEPPRLHPCDDAGVLVNLAIQRDVCFMALEHSLAGTIGTYTSEIIQQGALALAPCALLSRSERHLSCQPIQTAAGAVAPYIVGSALVSLPQWAAFQRRLLWDAPSGRDLELPWAALVPALLSNASEDWGGTGACEQLVPAARRNPAAFEADTAILERAALQHCLKWRAVARAARMQYDVPGTNDKALLSWQHALAAAAGGVQHILSAVVDNAPSSDGGAQPAARALRMAHEAAAAAFFALAQVEGFQPAAKLLVRTAVMAGRAWETTVAAERLRGAWARMTKQAPKPPQPSSAAQDTPGGAQGIKARAPPASPPPQACPPARNASSSTSRWEAAAGTAVPPLPAPPGSAPGSAPRARPAHAPPGPPPRHLRPGPRQRRLLRELPELGSAWPVDWSAYTVNLMAARHGDESVCDLADILTESVRVFYNSTSTFYARAGNESNLVRNAARTVATNVRSVVMRAVPLDEDDEARFEAFMLPTREGVPDTDWASFTYSSIEHAVDVIFGLRPAHLAAFFYPRIPLQEQIDRDLFTFPRILYDMSHCDTEKVMLCTGKPRALLTTVVLCFLALVVLGFVFWLSSGTTMLIIFFVLPWVVMWYAYGYSPMCFPMVPTCFMDDLVDAVNSTFPARVEWPSLLINEAQCTREGVPRSSVGADRGSVNCFRSCASPELGFKGWEDPLAWFVCAVDQDVCRWFAEYLSNTTAFASRYNDTTTYFISVLQYNNQDVNAAYHVCAAMTSFYIAPAFLVALWFLLMVGTLVSTVVLLLFKTFIFVLSVRSEQPRLPPDDDDDAGRTGDDNEPAASTALLRDEQEADPDAGDERVRDRARP